MIKRFSLCLSVMICYTAAFTQNFERVVLDSKDPVSGYYLAVKPQSNAIKGVVVLLDGFGGRAEDIFAESKLQNIAYANNLLTISLAIGNKMYADSVVISKLNAAFKDIISRYSIKPDTFVLGGFSAGGTIALRYTELCKENPTTYPIDPQAVFAVDAPVDLIDLWAYFEKQIAKNYSAISVNEAKFVSVLMEKEHGTPLTNLETYKWLTPFYNESKVEGNERFLKNTPVRVYHDVDVTWQLQNRRRSIYESNYLNTSEMILRLLLARNEAAEFIQGKKGYRNNGARHPHSWAIVDEEECVQWILKQL